MSIPEFSNTTNIQNDSAININPIQEENTNPAIDMDPAKKETVTPGPLASAKSKELLCIDMESFMEHQVGIRDQLETGSLVNLSEVTAQRISQKEERRKLSFKGLYAYMLGYGKQSQAPRSIWDRTQTPLQPEQAVWMQYGPTQIQTLPQSPLGGPQVQSPVKPSGPQFIQAQGGYFQGSPQGQGHYQGQGYGPPQYQGYGPPQGQAVYYQGQGQGPQQGYGQGSYPPQEPAQEGGLFDQNYEPERQRFEYDPATRNGFVGLVMFIVFVMLAMTAGAVGFVYFTPVANAYFRQARWEVLIISIVCLMIANYGLVCFPCGRVIPGNIICLLLAVVAMSLTLSKLTCHYKFEIIMYAVAATAVAVLICVMLACTSFDFTSYALYIIMASAAVTMIIIIVYLVAAVTGQRLTTLMIVLLIVATLVQVIVLAMELQMVIGGKAVQMSEDDYALAAFMLYMSIIEIFINLLKLFGLLDS